MIVTIVIITVKFALTEIQKSQLPWNRDFSVALRGYKYDREENLFVFMYVYVMNSFICMSQRQKGDTVSPLSSLPPQWGWVSACQ
jgi:hypothetical protein